MGKIGRAIKHNKVMLVLGVILVLCFLTLLYTLVKYFYNGLNSNAYGDRLEGIEEYKLDKNIEENINKLYDSIDSVGDVNISAKGKIIYITINYVKAIKPDDAKSLALKALEGFSDKEKGYYDIQYILTSDNITENTESFPTTGAKNASSSVVVWLNK
jgi:hypothetical protein